MRFSLGDTHQSRLILHFSDENTPFGFGYYETENQKHLRQKHLLSTIDSTLQNRSIFHASTNTHMTRESFTSLQSKMYYYNFPSFLSGKLILCCNQIKWACLHPETIVSSHWMFCLPLFSHSMYCRCVNVMTLHHGMN